MLSYDNLFCQASLIVSPLVLSAIYTHGKKWVYYFSSFLALISIVLIGYVSTWDTVAVIGKKSMYEVKEDEEAKESNQVEAETKESNPVEVKEEPAQVAVEMTEVKSTGDEHTEKSACSVSSQRPAWVLVGGNKEENHELR